MAAEVAGDTPVKDLVLDVKLGARADACLSMRHPELKGKNFAIALSSGKELIDEVERKTQLGKNFLEAPIRCTTFDEAYKGNIDTIGAPGH